MSRAVLAAALLAGCSGSTPPCDPPSNFGCEASQQCETVSGAEPRCLPPVVVSGRLVDSSSLRPVSNARVLLLDTAGVPVAAAATSRTDGVYVVRVPNPRNPDESPVTQTLFPRVDSSGYGRYPDGFRVAAPVTTGGAVLVADGSERLVSVPDLRLVSGAGGFGTGQIFGNVQLPPVREPVLVIAEPTPGPGTGAAVLADAQGGYRLFGLPPGNFLVRALAKGYDWVPVPLAVSSMSQLGTDLRLAGATAARVTGTLAYVPPSSGATSIVLAPAASYDAATARADLLPGLSAQVSAPGAFSITGVPAGTWVVLPAFANDGLVSASPLAQVTVTAGVDAAVSATQNVVAAIAIVGPGAAGLESVTAAPTLTWHDVSGETGYHVTVTNALGAEVWQRDEPAHAGDDPSVLYQGPLIPGQLYKLHVAATGTAMQTEDLLGSFTLPSP